MESESCEADQQWKVSNAVACFNGRGQRNKSTSSVSHYEKWMLSDSYHQSVPFIVWYKKHHPTITYFPLKTLLPRPKHCQSQDTLQGLPGKPISCKAALESGASLHLTSAAFNRYHIVMKQRFLRQFLSTENADTFQGCLVSQHVKNRFCCKDKEKTWGKKKLDPFNKILRL